MLHEAIECGTRTFLKANPDKAQKIADRYAALSFFGSRNIYNHERFKKEGCFFERYTFDRWVGSKTNRLSEVNKNSPFRIFMEKLLEMVGTLSEEREEKKLEAWLHDAKACWRLGRTDNEDKKGIYRQLVGMLPAPSYDLKAEGTYIGSRYPLLLSKGWQTDVMEEAHEGTVEYVHLVDAARKTK
jgi:hypothetical protein